MTQAANLEEVFCPSCGLWYGPQYINHGTGFCVECTPYPHFCGFCGKEYEPDEFTKKVCPGCKEEIWLRLNADKIDEYLKQGHSFAKAKQLVIEGNRPICLCCKQPIKGGKTGVSFLCRKTPDCRRAARRFRTLRERHGKAIAMTVLTLEYSTEGT